MRKQQGSRLDCKQSLSGQSRGCAHSAARLERGEINEKRLGERSFVSPFSRLSPTPFRSFAPVFSRWAISRDLSTIQKGTACSLEADWHNVYPSIQTIPQSFTRTRLLTVSGVRLIILRRIETISKNSTTFLFSLKYLSKTERLQMYTTHHDLQKKM